MARGGRPGCPAPLVTVAGGPDRASSGSACSPRSTGTPRNPATSKRWWPVRGQGRDREGGLPPHALPFVRHRSPAGGPQRRDRATAFGTCSAQHNAGLRPPRGRGSGGGVEIHSPHEGGSATSPVACHCSCTGGDMLGCTSKRGSARCLYISIPSTGLPRRTVRCGQRQRCRQLSSRRL